MPPLFLEHSNFMKLIGLVFFLVLTWAPASAQWVKQSVNTTASFRGLSVVSEKIVWASGTGGTVIKTTDAGRTWNVMTVPGAEKLDFRDIEAFDANTAYILSIGNGESSRIYKTTDGGATWKLQFTNKNEKAFFDAIACWDKYNCIAVSDPVDAQYLFMSTTDGGEGWFGILSDPRSTANAKAGEAAFAASGTCLYMSADRTVFLVSGGTDARVFRSDHLGEGWRTFNTPIRKGNAGSGIFSIAMLDTTIGVIVGGNYEKPAETENSLAFTADGGQTWSLGSGLSGFRSAVTYVDKKTIIAVGTNGTDISRDSGRIWKKIGTEDLNAVAAKGKNAVWAVGPKGMVVKLK